MDLGGVQERGKILEPAHIIRHKLDIEMIRPGKFDFYRPLLAAWDAFTYKKYDQNAWQQGTVDFDLKEQYEETRDPVVRLTEPEQLRMINAMAEAAGLPYQQGQSEFEIPAHLTEQVDRARRRQHSRAEKAF